jgi:adenylate kinase
VGLNRAFIFLGAPGAGKGTQSKRFAKQWGMPHFSTGDMLRDAISSGSKLGHIAKPIMERGELVSDKLVLDMVEERLTKLDVSRGFVFDGFPRTVPQAQELDAILVRRSFGKPVVVSFEVDPETLIRRLSGRWMCTVGGEIYNVNDAPPKVAGVCDHDGGKLAQRPDDRPEVVRQRLVAYEKLTRPLADYYRRKGVLDQVDGAAPIDEVTRKLAAIIVERTESFTRGVAVPS